MPALFWINKTAASQSLSHSDRNEQLSVYSHAQRTTRPKNQRLAHQQHQQQQQQQKKKKKKPPPNPTSPPSRVTNLPPSLAKPLPIPLTLTNPSPTSAERRSQTFFTHRTLLKIIPLQRDWTFWTQIVPRLAESHAAIRHLVVAIAATHELLLLDSGAESGTRDRGVMDAFALRQCNRATELLRKEAGHAAVLTASCVLVAAFCLLRCDLALAARCIESGVGMVGEKRGGGAAAEEQVVSRSILVQLARTHGFKLWASDVTFAFEKTRVRAMRVERVGGEEEEGEVGTGTTTTATTKNGLGNTIPTMLPAEDRLVIETNWIRGPFTSPYDVVQGYKNVMVQMVAKVMRNLARGAYIDIESPLGRAMREQIDLLSFHWQTLYDGVPSVASPSSSVSCDSAKDEIDPGHESLRLALIQLRMGIIQIQLVFWMKLVSRREQAFDTNLTLCDEMLAWGRIVMAARRVGREVLYMDRIVMGALFTMGFASNGTRVKQEVIKLLASQIDLVDDDEERLILWVRVVLLEVLQRLDERVRNRCMGGNVGENGGPVMRISLVNVSVEHEQRCFLVDYSLGKEEGDGTIHQESIAVERDVDVLGAKESPWETPLLDGSLEGIQAAYRTYAKQRIVEAPDGYVREMEFQGERVEVFWEDDMNQS